MKKKKQKIEKQKKKKWTKKTKRKIAHMLETIHGTDRKLEESS